MHENIEKATENCVRLESIDRTTEELMIELNKDVQYNFNFRIECPIRVKIYSVLDKNSKLKKIRFK